MSEPDPDTAELAPTPEPAHKPVRKRRGLRILAWVSASVVLLLVLAAIGVVSIMGRQMTAPDWLREEISARLNSQLNGAEVTFGDMSVLVERDWIPQVQLRNIEVSNPDGTPIARLSEVEGTLALRPLLRGEIQPGRVYLSGASLQLRRSVEGNLGVAVGQLDAPAQDAPSFPALIEQLDGVLSQPDLKDLRSIEVDNLTVRYEDARARQAWTVDGGRLWLTREGDDLDLRGDFALLGNRGFATTLEVNYEGVIGDTAATLGLSFSDMPARDIAKQSPALAWLEALQAPLSGALRVGVEEDGALGPLNATLQFGAGALQPSEATKPIPFSSAQAYFTYDPATQAMLFDEVFLESSWVTARASGKAFLVGMEQGLPTELWAQVQVSELSANPDSLYPEPVTIEGATMDMRVALDPFVLTLGEMSLSDQGQRLELRGSLEAQEQGWALAVDGRMDGLSPQRLVALWPESIKTNTRNWIRDNVSSADLQNLKLAVRATPDAPPELYLGFDFANMTTRFMKAMPVIEAARGYGSLYGERFVLAAEEGFITAPQGGRVDISGTQVVIPSVAFKQPPAEVKLSTSSSVTAALALLDHEPFRFLSKADQPVTLAEGQVRTKGALAFTLKPKLAPADVTFDIAATARNVRSDTLVKNRVLTAPSIDITARDNTLTISGAGRIGDVPAEGTWQSDIGPGADGQSSLRGTVELSKRFADEFGIGLPPGSISGRGRGAIEIDFAKGQPGTFRLSSNLAGLGLRLSALDWRLSEGGQGSLNVTGSLGTPPDIRSVAIDAAGLRAEGSVSLRPDGQLDRARFARVRAGSWLDAPVELVGRGKGATPAVRVTGGMIDMRQTSLGGEGQSASSGQGGPVTLALDRLQISDSITLNDFRADLNMRRGAEGTFAATVNNGAAVQGTVVPQGNRSAFRIRSDNAGGVLRSAGLLKNARSGQMDLILAPGTLAGSYNGELRVNQLRLKDAPALAALLNALSVVGILEQLNGDGIHFSEVEAAFQLTPDRVTLVRGSAVGASLGISMEGYYFFDRREMDMQGVFSPIYLVNAVGGIFTRKGEGLIGFNYRLNGPPDGPRVRVNPLSALTPGMFREIFRKPPPEIQR